MRTIFSPREPAATHARASISIRRSKRTHITQVSTGTVVALAGATVVSATPERKRRIAAALLVPLIALPFGLRAAIDEGLLRAVWRLKEGLPIVQASEQPLQRKLYDCGPAVLAEALRQRGVAANSEVIEGLAATTVRGTTMLGLQRAALALGAPADGLMLGFDDLRRTPLPAIAFVRRNHFVLVTAIDGDAVALLDPSIGHMRLGRSQFLRQWQGETLVFRAPR
jgi:hypothetical protein